MPGYFTNVATIQMNADGDLVGMGIANAVDVPRGGRKDVYVPRVKAMLGARYKGARGRDVKPLAVFCAA